MTRGLPRRLHLPPTIEPPRTRFRWWKGLQLIRLAPAYQYIIYIEKGFFTLRRDFLHFYIEKGWPARLLIVLGVSLPTFMYVVKQYTLWLLVISQPTLMDVVKQIYLVTTRTTCPHHTSQQGVQALSSQESTWPVKTEDPPRSCQLWRTRAKTIVKPTCLFEVHHGTSTTPENMRTLLINAYLVHPRNE